MLIGVLDFFLGYNKIMGDEREREREGGRVKGYYALPGDIF